MQRRARQTDVAKLAGVSPATVSVILNNRLDSNVRISAETRARVLAAVEQLGYVTDPVARSLAGGQNSLLGVFTFESIFPVQQRDFYYPFLVGIEREAEQLGYDLLLFTSTGSADGHRRIYRGNINRLQLADGAILLGSEQRKDELARLVDDQYPFVFVGRRELPDRTLSYVAADYATATARIVGEMLTQGHRQIAYLGPLRDNESHRDRYAGYLMAFRQSGLNHLARTAQRIPAAQLTPAFLQQALGEGATAFVIESGGGLIEPFFAAMAILGKRAPADFSVAILGDPMTGFEAPYPVTSFRIPREEMGRRAVQLLVELLHAPQRQSVRQAVIPCTPVSGLTIAPPAVPS
jgi:DNA-binding LacI/PurR family transcriptional regulator